jgi:prephenate dehydrogenase
VAAEPTRIAILGLGLIGGSIARALRADPGRWSVAAWTPNGTAPRVAQDAGIIERAASSPADAASGADLVVLAAPPLECLVLLRDLAGPSRSSLAPDAVITDVASTKGAIGSLAQDLGLPFVGGHPMAGREASGFAAADARLFVGRPWVIVPVADHADPAEDDAAVARVEGLAAACGARPLRMAADEHDRVAAAISHLPLVLSAALVEAVAGPLDRPRADWRAASGLAAGGWESMTRLARGDVEMGTGIASTNAAEIASRLRAVREVIDAWIADLDAGDTAAIRERLAEARAVLIDGD